MPCFLANTFICDFVTAILRLTALGRVLDKTGYCIFSCIGLNNEHPLSLVDVIDR